MDLSISILTWVVTYEGIAPHARTLPTTVPVFSAGLSYSSSDVLAATALSPKVPILLPGLGLLHASVTAPGPHNPVGMVAPKVAKRILELEFVESRLRTATHLVGGLRVRCDHLDHLSQTSRCGWRDSPSRQGYWWLDSPRRRQNFSPIRRLKAERNYVDKQWVLYDRQYRREALARKDLNWSIPNVRLYNEAFTGRAWAIPRYTYCLADDHTASNCPTNPVSHTPMAFSYAQHPPTQPGPAQHLALPEVCRNFNDCRCKRPTGRYQHLCLSCHEAHPWLSCPRRRARGRGSNSRLAAQRSGTGLGHPIWGQNSVINLCPIVMTNYILSMSQCWW